MTLIEALIESLLFDNPITCANGKQHERYDGCDYCRNEALQAKLTERDKQIKELEERLGIKK